MTYMEKILTAVQWYVQATFWFTLMAIAVVVVVKHIKD